MSYASDNDDLEQCAQGADNEATTFELFVEEMMGEQYIMLSNSERANVDFQWRQQMNNWR